MLDAPGIPINSLYRNLEELEQINKYLGGHAISMEGLKRLVRDKNKKYHVVDIGCGGGDTLIAFAQWARKEGYAIKFTGVDTNEDTIRYFQKRCSAYAEIASVKNDYSTFLTSVQEVDIVHCSLFCHHLTDDMLDHLFKIIKDKARVGFIVNDLHRHPLAYYSIKFLTRLFNGSILVKNDAPLSVLRGFRFSELNTFLCQAGINDFTMQWKWAFRYLIVAKTPSDT